ncbi:MAG: DNA gyrase subunit A [Rhodospirillaceae bacterium]|nr:DNA gyrase subunit A [Rhodospirillaceae bacterium]
MTDTPPTPPAFDIAPVSIEEEMKRSYLDYAMSVIVSRAVPDVRDGLKPVHRRILYSMHENGYDHTKPYRKSARVIGDVMGKYHPHGESAIYDAMVRMAQDFSMRLPLIDGQGNFGSMDGDPAAAMRYTEVRMARSATAILEDIDKDTVDFVPNYDNSEKEPVVLPARFPNLLVNGAGGIAVGMATNIPPHNLGEVIDACVAMIDDPEIGIDGLMDYVKGPDFPTGATILGRAGIVAAYHTGRGSVVMRGRTEIEPIGKDREAIIVTEIPYQVNKSRMVEQIAEAVRDKRVEGISDLRDESDRDGVRVVIELRRDAVAEVVLNQLYRFTALQTSFGVNMLALNGGRPQQLTLKDVLRAFLDFREEVITKRTIFELGKARARAHVLAGLAVAVANIDEVIALIRNAPDPATAREQLMAKPWPARDVGPLIELINEAGHAYRDGTYTLSETQARAILDLRLHRLTGLERDKIAEELQTIVDRIQEFLAILGSREKLLEVLRTELAEVRERFANPRRTDIEESEFDYDIEDLIQREDMVVTVTHAGYIKRVPLSTYRSQRRGGKGRAGMATRDEDFVDRIFVASTHTPVLFFSSSGKVYKLKVYRLPLLAPQARGKPMINLLPLAERERIWAIMPLPEDEETWGELNVLFATSAGNVRRNDLSQFSDVRANGKIAIKLEDEETLVGVDVCTADHDVLLATNRGKSIRFPVTDVRVFSGTYSAGVRGIRLEDGDAVISMSIINHAAADTDERDAYLRRANALRRAAGGNGGESDGDGAEAETPASAEGLGDERFEELAAAEEFILGVTDDGYGKRTSAYEYRITGRGGKGIDNMDLSRPTGRSPSVIAAFPVEDQDQLMLVTDRGQIIRLPVDGIRIAGRTTRGVTLFRVAEDERVVSVTRLTAAEAEEADEDDTTSEDGGESSGG